MADPQPASKRRVERESEVEDAELVRRAQLGSAAAFEALVVRHGPRLHRYLRVELRHDSDAHDALQEALAAAWRGLPDLRRADRFWPWLVGIASHKAADIHRGRGRSADIDADVTHDDSLLLETKEALSALPAQHREVLLLRYLLGLTEEEAAAALGVRVGTIKSRCSRARRALLEELR
jgi:RNA polymerase sigma-70 factor (ECF subfamily)